MFYLSLFFFLPLFAFFYQLYKYADSRQGLHKQQACLALGITYSTVGIAILVSRNLFLVVAGFVLMMFGLRLIAKGLDRQDKKIFIDRFEEDRQ